MIQSDEIEFEVEDNFQKQTNRSRMYIYSASGIQLLNIPVKHTKEVHQKYKEIIIDETYDWQKNHFKSLESAYKNSPFYEYFVDDIIPIFQKKHKYLLDLNLETFEIVNDCLGINIPYSKTTEYFHKVENIKDFRHLVTRITTRITIRATATHTSQPAHRMLRHLPHRRRSHPSLMRRL